MAASPDTQIRARLAVVGGSQALAQIRSFRAEVVGLNGTQGRARADVDTTAGKAALAAFRADTARLRAETYRAKVEADTTVAARDLAQFRATTQRMQAETTRVRVELQADRALRDAQSLKARLDTLGKIAVDVAPAAGYAAAIRAAVAPSLAVGQNLKDASIFAKATNAEIAQMTRTAGAFTALGIGPRAASSAQVELSRAGVNGRDLARVTGDALNLSRAGDVDTPTAATTLTDTANAFGIGLDKTGRIADLYASAANASSASTEQLIAAMAQGGQAAASMGQSLDDTLSVLALFADRGLKGSDAGTSLRTMMLRLVPSSKEAKEAIQQYGLSFTDAEGRVKSYAAVAEELRTKLGGLSDAQRTGVLKTIFGDDSFRTANILTKEGAAGVGKYNSEVQSGTTAASVAAQRMDTAAGSVARFGAEWEKAGVAVGNALGPLVQGAAAVGTLAAQTVQLAPPTLVRDLAVIAGAAVAYRTVAGVIGTVRAATAALSAAQAIATAATVADTAATEANTAAKARNAAAGRGGRVAGRVGVGALVGYEIGQAVIAYAGSQQAERGGARAKVEGEELVRNLMGETDPAAARRMAENYLGQIDNAIADAKRARAANAGGPLHGVPVLGGVADFVGLNANEEYDAYIRTLEEYRPKLEQATQGAGAAVAQGNATAAAAIARSAEDLQKATDTALDAYRTLAEQQRLIRMGFTPGEAVDTTNPAGDAAAIHMQQQREKRLTAIYAGLPQVLGGLTGGGIQGLASAAPELKRMTDDLQRLGGVRIAGLDNLAKFAGDFRQLAKDEAAASEAFNGFLLSLDGGDRRIQSLNALEQRVRGIAEAAARAQQRGTSTPQQDEFLRNLPAIYGNIERSRGDIYGQMTPDALGLVRSVPDYAGFYGRERDGIAAAGGGAAIIRLTTTGVEAAQEQIRAITDPPLPYTATATVNANTDPAARQVRDYVVTEGNRSRVEIPVTGDFTEFDRMMRQRLAAGYYDPPKSGGEPTTYPGTYRADLNQYGYADGRPAGPPAPFNANNYLPGSVNTQPGGPGTAPVNPAGSGAPDVGQIAANIGNAIVGWFSRLGSNGLPIGQGGTNLPGARAMGGPMAAGRGYIVGDSKSGAPTGYEEYVEDGVVYPHEHPLTQLMLRQTGVARHAYGTAPDVPASMLPFMGKIAAYARKYNLPPEVVAALVLRESSGDPFALAHEQNGTTSHGLLQANSVHSGNPAWAGILAGDVDAQLDFGVGHLADDYQYFLGRGNGPEQAVRLMVQAQFGGRYGTINGIPSADKVYQTLPQFAAHYGGATYAAYGGTGSGVSGPASGTQANALSPVRQRVIAAAQRYLDSPDFAGQCERLAEVILGEGTGQRGGNGLYEATAYAAMQRAQAEGRTVGAADARPGDLVYYAPDGSRGIPGAGHAAIYAGDGMMYSSNFIGNDTGKVKLIPVAAGAVYARPANLVGDASGTASPNAYPGDDRNQRNNRAPAGHTGGTQDYTRATAPPYVPPLAQLGSNAGMLGMLLPLLTGGGVGDVSSWMGRFAQGDNAARQRALVEQYGEGNVPKPFADAATRQSQEGAARFGVEFANALVTAQNPAGNLSQHFERIRAAGGPIAEQAIRWLIAQQHILTVTGQIEARNKEIARAQDAVAAVQRQWAHEDRDIATARRHDAAVDSAADFAIQWGRASIQRGWAADDRAETGAKWKRDDAWTSKSRSMQDKARELDFRQGANRRDLDDSLTNLRKQQTETGYQRTSEEQLLFARVKGADTNGEAARLAGQLAGMRDDDLVTKDRNAEEIDRLEKKAQLQAKLDDQERYNLETKQLAATREHEDAEITVARRIEREQQARAALQETWSLDDMLRSRGHELTMERQAEVDAAREAGHAKVLEDAEDYVKGLGKLNELGQEQIAQAEKAKQGVGGVLDLFTSWVQTVGPQAQALLGPVSSTNVAGGSNAGAGNRGTYKAPTGETVALPRYATGTDWAAPGLAIVGDTPSGDLRDASVVRMFGGERVIPANVRPVRQRTTAPASGDTRGGGFTFNAGPIQIADGTDEEAIVRRVQAMVADQVRAALRAAKDRTYARGA